MKTCDEANNQYTFESLTPFADSELGIYESALDYVFEHPEIRNIALSGSYGAGKSSVLASYEKKHEKERNYLHISLAHFTDESEVASDQVKESVLEGKIVQRRTLADGFGVLVLNGVAVDGQHGAVRIIQIYAGCVHVELAG